MGIHYRNESETWDNHDGRELPARSQALKPDALDFNRVVRKSDLYKL